MSSFETGLCKFVVVVMLLLTSVCLCDCNMITLETIDL